MKRSRKLLSFLLSLALVVSMIPAFGVTVSAESPLPNFKVENGVISWDHVKGADEYDLSGLITNASLVFVQGDYAGDHNSPAYRDWTDTGVVFRLKDYLDNKAVCLPGTYDLNVSAFRNGEFLGYQSSFSYAFDSTITQLQTPTSLRWKGRTASWDPVPNAAKYVVFFYENDTFVRSFTISGTSYTFDPSLFMNSEAHVYQFHVRAFADGYVGSDSAESEKVSGASILGGYDSAGGSVRISGGSADKKTAAAGQTVKVTAIPGGSDFTFEGWNAVAGRMSFANKTGASTTFTMPSGNVAVSGSYRINTDSAGDPWSGKTNPFVDVSKGAYYYDPVLWAYYSDPQVTTGMDATHFGPSSTVTRGQCVAFLWRAMGEPEPTTKTNPFVDVPANEYYYKPVLWAVEKGITKGTDATHFTPGQKLSTAHITTFLYRTLGKGTDGWFEEAGNWARGEGLLEGTGLTVSDQVNCPRGAVVTFLFRELADTASGANELGEDEFLIYVEDYFNVTGRGRVITGRVENGSVRTGDRVTLISHDEKTGAPVRTTYTVQSIEMFRKILDEAQKGDNVGILLSANTDIKTPKGAALVREGSPLKSTPGRYVGTVKMNNTFKREILPGSLFQVYWVGSDVSAMLVDLNGPELKPDTTREGVSLTLLYPEVFYIGQELALRQGGRTLGTFTVTGIR